MAIPDYQTLMLPVLKFAAEGETRVPEVESRIADAFGLTAEEREALLPSGRQKVLHNRIHWSKFYLSKAGLIEMPRRGRFVATAAGRKLLARGPDRIDVELLAKESPSFKAFYAGGERAERAVADVPLSAAPVAVTPEEQIEGAYAAILSSLRADLIQRILQNSPGFFEHVIVDLLLAMGYGGSRRSAASQLGRSGDGGVDGVINEDRLGLDRVYVQAKRYAEGNPVGRPEVQAFVGSLVGLGASKGVFVTTSTFIRASVARELFKAGPRAKGASAVWSRQALSGNADIKRAYGDRRAQLLDEARRGGGMRRQRSRDPAILVVERQVERLKAENAELRRQLAAYEAKFRTMVMNLHRGETTEEGLDNPLPERVERRPRDD